MKLKFNCDAVYNGEVIYHAGDIKDVPSDNGFAARWVKRGVAVVAEEQEGPKTDQPIIKERSGGSMSVDRVDALAKNSSLIRDMTLPAVPSNSRTGKKGTKAVVETAVNPKQDEVEL